MTIVEEADVKWKTTPWRGVRFKFLSDEESTGAWPMAWKMEKGSALPAHKHQSSEDFYMFQGSLKGPDGSVVEAEVYGHIPALVRHGPFKALKDSAIFARYAGAPSLILDDGTIYLFNKRGTQKGKLQA